MTEIAIADYKDYLNFTGKKVCFHCKEEYPQEAQFYSPFTLGDKMCEGCYTETLRALGDENL